MGMKRLFSFILALTIMIGMGPVQVLAIDTDSGSTPDSITGEGFIEHNLAHIGVSNTMGNTSGTILEVTDFPALPYSIYETAEGCYGLEDILSTKTEARTAYYVDSEAGSDDNSGTEEDAAFRTLKKALTAAAGKAAEITILNDNAVFFADELYGNYTVNQTTVIRAKTGATILCGMEDAGFKPLAGSANTYVSGDLTGYTIETSDGISAVVDTDSRNVDEMGIYRAMIPVASPEEVDTTKGAYFYDADTARMYVNPRYDIASIYPLTGVYSFRFNLSKAAGDTLLYLENLNVIGNFLLNGHSASDDGDDRNLEFAANNCTFQHDFMNNCVSVHNFNGSYMADCRVGYSLLDGYNYHATHLTTAQRLKAIHVEVNCQAENCGYYRMMFGVGPVNNNLSTAHEGINVLRVNFSGHDSYGPQIADVNGCRSVNIDCTISNSYQYKGSAGNFQFTETSAIRKANITLINCCANDTRSGELRLYSNVERTTVVGGNLLERNFYKVHGELLTEVQEHTHSYTAEVIAPDCTEQGYTAYRCILCDDGHADSYVDALGHQYGAWRVTVVPTCTEAGTERRDCDVCDHYETRPIAETGHDYKAIVTAPTCTEQGYTTYTCACGDRYVDNYTDELGHLNAWAETLADGEKLVLTELNVIKHNKSLIFSANVTDLGDGLIRISHGQNAYGGNHLEITSDKIRVYTTNSSTSVKEYSHGLQIAGDISVRLDVPRSKATITIATASGTYKKSVSWSGCNGDISCSVEGTTLQNVDLRWFATGIESDYWFFGDSWFSTTSSARWTSYLLDDGYMDVLLAGYPGMRAPAGLTQFQELLTLDTPKYAVWALGMNNGDRNGAVNESWLTSTEEFLRLCGQYGVTPILCTIPTTPKVNNRLKNAWIRQSGCRYIDFDLAVVEDHITGTWFDGMAASDLNHPSELGAKALYPQVFADFPELAKADPAACSHSMHLLERRNGQCEYGGRGAYYVCSLCGGQYLDEKGLVRTSTDQMLTDPPGHVWSDWTVVREPDDIQSGVQERSCTDCGEREQEELPKLEVLYGDANGDGQINGLDLILLRQYLAGWDVSIDSTAADVTGDGKCNALDLIRLRQYLAGWDVTLGTV